MSQQLFLRFASLGSLAVVVVVVVICGRLFERLLVGLVSGVCDDGLWQEMGSDSMATSSCSTVVNEADRMMRPTASHSVN